MEFIKYLVDKKYKLFNVNQAKAPVNKHNNPMNEWQDKTYKELCAEHNYESKLWGMKLGEQPNGKYILSLDFDLWDKEAKKTDKKTEKRLQDYLNQIKINDGMYTSSTEGNINVLVDYTNCEK